MKYKISTIPHQYRTEYFGKGVNKDKKSYEYSTIVYSASTLSREGTNVAATYDLESITDGTDVLLFDAASCHFSFDEGYLVLTVENGIAVNPTIEDNNLKISFL